MPEKEEISKVMLEIIVKKLPIIFRSWCSASHSPEKKKKKKLEKLQFIILQIFFEQTKCSQNNGVPTTMNQSMHEQRAILPLKHILHGQETVHEGS